MRKDLRRWLRRLQDEVRATTVFVTHDQQEAMEVADRIVRHEPRPYRAGRRARRRLPALSLRLNPGEDVYIRPTVLRVSGAAPGSGIPPAPKRQPQRVRG